METETAPSAYKTETEEYTLKHPIEVPAEIIKGVNGHPDIVSKPASIYSVLVFHPVEGGNMVPIEHAAKAGNEARVKLVMISELARIPLAIAAKLKLEDYDRASEIAGSFFPTPPAQSKAGGIE